MSMNLSKITKRYATWASKASQAGQQSLESKVLDPWTPTAYKNRPTFYTAEGTLPLNNNNQTGRDYWKKTMGKFAQRMLYVGMIKTYGKGIKFIGFAKDAEKKYIDMNNAFALQDRNALGVLCTDALVTEKNTSLKQLNRAGSISNPKTVHIVHAKVDMGTGKPQHLSQMTVMMNTWQSLVVYGQKGEIVAGSVEKKAVKEYVVFERMVSQPDSEWKICKSFTKDD